MRFIWTGRKWVNGDKIRDVGIHKGVASANKEKMEIAKKKGFQISNTVDPERYQVTVFNVMITMDDGEWEEYDPLLKWKARGEAEDTAMKLIQELEDR